MAGRTVGSVSAEVIVALAGVVVAAAAFLVGVLYQRRQYQLASYEARRSEARLVEERQARLEERQAQPSAELVEGPLEKQGGYEYCFKIRNLGHDLADNLTVWLEDGAGAEVTEQINLVTLFAGDEKQVRLLARTVDRPLQLYYKWVDRTGKYQRPSRVNVPLH
jgi:hypothetical protein